MDFSKIKKIFYIVAIISMLLSIKSKVFAATVDTSDGISYNVPQHIYDDYYFLAFRFPNSIDTNWYILLSNTPCTLEFINDNNRIKVQTTATNNGRIFTHFSGGDLQYLLNQFENYYPQPPNGYNQVSKFYDFSSLPSDVEYICNYDVYNTNTGDKIFTSTVPTTVYPFFDNTTEIENGNPDGVFISPGYYSSNDYLYFHLLEVTTGMANQDNSRYYYNDKTFALNKDSDFYRTWVDPNIDGYYYYIPRYKLGLSQNTSYLYVLNNSKDQIQNSNGIIQIDKPNGIYDVVESDTSGVITATEEETDRMKNIESTITQNQETVNNINDTLTNTNIDQNTETDIDTNLNFSNSAPQFSSLFNGFFSRLTTIISDLGNYQDTDVITVSLPIPFTNDTIPIRSDFIFSNQNNNFLKNISILLWYFIFGKYFLYFLINTYWLITNGQFFKFYLTQKEAITSDML